MTNPFSYTIEFKARKHPTGWEVYRLTTDQWGQKEQHLAIVDDMQEAYGLVDQLTEETQGIMRKLAHQLGGRIETKP